jgi:PAS domain S-box-containing protein
MENELSRVIDALPGLVWTALPDGHIDFLNQRWCEYTGVRAEDALGQGWPQVIHPDDLPALLAGWSSIVASGQPGEVEARMRRFDGEYRLFLFQAGPARDASGGIVRWCGMNTDIEDRRRAEDAVRAREGHFRSIFDGLPALVTVMTPAGDLEVANRHVLEFFGASLDELKGWARGASFHPDDYPAVLTAWERSRAAGDPYDCEARQRRADGVYRWVRIRGFPLRDSSGRIVNWYFLQADIDDARRAETLLAGEKRLLEMVASGQPLPVVLDALCRFVEEIDAGCHCGILFFDRSGATWQQAIGPGLPSGYNETMHGRPAHRASGPCGLAAFLKAPVVVSDVMTDGQWEVHGWRRLALSHGLRSCWSSPILSQDKTALGALALYRDEPGGPTRFQQDLIRQLTHIASIAVERARGEDALRRSEAFLAEAQRLSSTGSFLWRVATDEITWSEQAHRIYEFAHGQPVTLEMLVSRTHPQDRLLLSEVIEQARRDGPDFQHEHRLQMPDGSIKHLHTVAHATRDQDGQLEYIGAVQDVTQRRLSDEALGKVRSELARVARATSLGALTASIAHEVNQPLSGIITNASTCLRMLSTDPPNINGALETARRTIRDGNRASDVITRLRALFAKTGAPTEAVDLNEATGEVIALSWSDLQRRRVLLRSELGDDLPTVVGDRVQLQQVIFNLIANASDAMSEVHDRPRQLVIRTERDEDDRVRLTVQDAGEGFAGEAAERLFDAFYTTKSGGMGIGLSVSRSIIESHRGRLWAAPNDGPGAAFSFSIPCAREAVPSPRDLAAMRPPAMAHPGRVVRTR